eukprot:3550731-Amphidinium_carterae.3
MKNWGRNLVAVNESAKRKEITQHKGKGKGAQDQREKQHEHKQRNNQYDDWEWRWDNDSQVWVWDQPTTERTSTRLEDRTVASERNSRSRSPRERETLLQGGSSSTQDVPEHHASQGHSCKKLPEPECSQTDATKHEQPDQVRTEPLSRVRTQQQMQPDQQDQEPEANFDKLWLPLQDSMISARITFWEIKMAIHRYYAILNPEECPNIEEKFQKYAGNEIGLAKSIVKKHTRGNADVTVEFFKELLKRARADAGVAAATANSNQCAHNASAGTDLEKEGLHITLTLLCTSLAATTMPCYAIQSWTDLYGHGLERKQAWKSAAGKAENHRSLTRRNKRLCRNWRHLRILVHDSTVGELKDATRAFCAGSYPAKSANWDSRFDKYAQSEHEVVRKIIAEYTRGNPRETLALYRATLSRARQRNGRRLGI